jgi:hypothetical protein
MKKVALDFGTPNPIQQRALDLFRAGKRIVLIATGRQAGKAMRERDGWSGKYSTLTPRTN